MPHAIPDFRAAATRHHADVIEAVSALIEQLVERHGRASRSPAREVARAAA